MPRLTALLISMLMFVISQNCFSQKKNKADVIDTMFVNDDAHFSVRDFVNGDMTLRSGSKVYGQLRFNGSTVIFKDSLTQKTKRYGTDEITEFTAAVDDSLISTYVKLDSGAELVRHGDKKKRDIYFLARDMNTFFKTDTFKVRLDTFAVTPSPHMADFGKKYMISGHFVKEIIYGNHLCLYKSLTSGYSGGSFNGGVMTGGGVSTSNVFYFKRNNEKSYTELPLGRRAFKKLMAIYLKDDPKLVDDINKEILDYSKIDQIVDRYNQDTNAG